MALQAGFLHVSAVNDGSQPEDFPGEAHIPLHTAQVTKITDVDGIVRVRISYVVEETGSTERVVLEPSGNADEVHTTLMQLFATAQLQAAQWMNRCTIAVKDTDRDACRSYELASGVLRVFTGEGDLREHEFDMPIADCYVELAALPGKPHCITVVPTDEAESGAPRRHCT